MKTPAAPANEADRVAELESYEVLDTAPEGVYDDIVRLASAICGTPIALVSLVDGGRQWFKAKLGLGASETSRDVSFCGHVVEQGSYMEVEDAYADERFADNPLVTGAPNVRFYAGADLTTEKGHVLGTLCVIDHEPRKLSDEQREALSALSRLVVRQLELRRRSKELERVNTLQRAFFELQVDMLCVVGFDGYFEELNPSWTRVLGHSEEELKSRPFVECVHPDDQEATTAEASKLASGEVTVHFENRYRDRDGGYRWLAWSARADLEHERIIATARDITEDRAAAEALRVAKEAADAANAAKSEFLASMSHELRTPLNSVIGFSNLLLKNRAGNLKDNDLKYLQRIQANGTHLLRLISEILDLSKLEAGKVELEMTSVVASVVITAALEKTESMIGAAGAELSHNLPSGLHPIRADAHRLEQVIINLVSNALKFTPSGRVEVRLRADGSTPTRIEVADTGVGIPAEKVAEIFSPFRQADSSTTREFGGTGLGLTISRALCEEMGFALQVASVEGMGSVFAIELVPDAGPLEYEPPSRNSPTFIAPREQPAARVSPRRSGKKMVLVVDDEADARALISRSLEDLGYGVVAVDSAETGLRVAPQLKPDLITMDLRMPGMDGWAALASLREHAELRNVPIVVISAEGAENRASLASGIAVVDKPFEDRRLAGVVDELLNGSQTRRVLIVEDSPDAANLMVGWLSESGLEVTMASNGQQGLQCVQRERPDLIVLDLKMPVVDGFEFLRRLRGELGESELPVVICSGADLTGDERLRLQSSAQAIVGKGETLERDLREICSQLLSSESSGLMPVPHPA